MKSSYRGAGCEKIMAEKYLLAVNWFKDGPERNPDVIPHIIDLDDVIEAGDEEKIIPVLEKFVNDLCDKGSIFYTGPLDKGMLKEIRIHHLRPFKRMDGTDGNAIPLLFAVQDMAALQERKAALKK